MSYQAGMIIPNQEKLSFNGVYFATEKEADAAGNELLSRWYVPTGFKIIEKEDPVNYKFNFESYKPEIIEANNVKAYRQPR